MLDHVSEYDAEDQDSPRPFCASSKSAARKPPTRRAQVALRATASQEVGNGGGGRAGTISAMLGAVTQQAASTTCWYTAKATRLVTSDSDYYCHFGSP